MPKTVAGHADLAAAGLEQHHLIEVGPLVDWQLKRAGGFAGWQVCPTQWTTPPALQPPLMLSGPQTTLRAEQEAEGGRKGTGDHVTLHGDN